MSSVKTEFLVQMTCDSCVQAVKNSLANLDGVLNVEINFSTGSVVVDSTLSIPQIQSALESTGRKVAIKGYDGSISAVSMLNTGDVQGVVRFVQINRDTCIVDGTIDGLHPVSHSLAVHEYGDLSKGCQSVGNIMHLGNETDRVYGDLGSISVEENGRASFRFEDHIIKLSELIGRSLVVKAKINNSTEKPITCGIIARSAGLFQNPKTICACDGISIWDEVSKPKTKSSL